LPITSSRRLVQSWIWSKKMLAIRLDIQGT